MTRRDTDSLDTDDTASPFDWFRPDVRRAVHAARDFNLAGDCEINSDLLGLDCDDEEEGWTLVLPGDPMFNLLTDLLGDLLRSGPFPDEHTAADCARCPVRSRCPGSKAKGD